MDFFERIKYYIDYKGETINSFTLKCGFSSGLIAKLITNKTAIGSDKLMKIFQIFPDLNPTWLLIGIGNMLIDSKNETLTSTEVSEPISLYGCKDCIQKERLIKSQEEIIDVLKDTISILKENCTSKRDSA